MLTVSGVARVRVVTSWYHSAVHPLPAGYEPGTWGAVLLARKGRVPTGSRDPLWKEVGTRSTPANPTD